MSAFNCEKGSPLWTLWADLFLLWREHGNVRSKQDSFEWANTACKVADKYKDTDENDLCCNVISAMNHVAHERYLVNAK